MIGSTYRARHAAPRPERGRLQAIAAGTAATLVLGGLALATTVPAANAEEACTRKCYSAYVRPQSSPANTTVPFTVTLTNLRAQRLGSANITPPTGYTVTSTPTTTKGTVLLVGGVLQLRQADVAEGSDVVIAFSAKTPSASGPYTWGSVAHQANDFNDPFGGANLLELDRSVSDLTTEVTAGTATNICPPGTVSCSSNTLDYSKENTFSTGADADAVKWLVGTIYFPATGSTGTQNYQMRASAVPGNYCPLGANTVQCTYEMYIDPVPAPYTGANTATLVLVCDVTKCPGTLLSSTKNDEENEEISPIIPCLPTTAVLCYEQERQGDLDLQVTYRNLGAGDPKIAGLTDSLTPA